VFTLSRRGCLDVRIPAPERVTALHGSGPGGTLCAVRQADAQRSTDAAGPISAGMTVANPLQAVLVSSYSPSRDPKLPPPRLGEPRAVARNSQGRVRLDRIVGKPHMETARTPDPTLKCTPSLSANPGSIESFSSTMPIARPPYVL
jgi:hypothetical protein